MKRPLLALAWVALAAGCGASGLQVANSGRTTPVTQPPASQPKVDRLDAIDFPDRDHGWAAGPGVIIATADAGASWARQYRGSADVRSLQFIDSQHGWAVASDALLRTTDGGAGWSAAAEPAGMVLTQVDFVTTDRGWGIAQRSGPGDATGPAVGALVSSDDGGASWTVVKRRAGQTLCASAGDLIAGSGSKVLRSSDGGQSWSTLLDAGSEGWFTASVQCPDLQSIWVLFEGGAAAGSQAYAAYVSGDAGSGWQPVVAAPMLVGSDPALHDAAPLDNYPGPFDAVSAQEAVFLGQCPACTPQHVTVLRTSDGGGSWARKPVNGFVPTGLTFADAQHGWMTTLIGGLEGRRSAILATTDGGRSWHPVFPS
jgi:photosystem II stability/assembly factor-like uncharacterized protein